MLIGYGVGEVVDRLSILALKLQHKPTDAYQREFDQLMRDDRLQLEPRKVHLTGIMLALATVNGELWAHEDQIRAVRKAVAAGMAGRLEAAAVAMEIQELNDRRAALVASLNNGSGT